MNAPNKSGNSRTIMIVLGIAALLALGTCCVAGAVVAGAISAAANLDRTYYPECEMVAGEACKLCCNQKGHNGYITGSIGQDDDRICGCL